ncbi:Rv1733c family protein [Streptomyces flavalbus]|uniref:Integral membrane protein n=1 Tax=Streptomyces flavalbus TaxID=2665155 RepID=A0ABW2W3G0_9ACTN
MPASRRARVRLWRWRRSPLRRRCDVIEAWVVLLGWVLALLGGALAGMAAAHGVQRAADAQRAERQRVTAELVEDAGDQVPSRVPSDYRVWATVRWTDRDGLTRTDEARVPARSAAGSEVAVWTDRGGAVVPEPLSAGEARMHMAAGGVLTALGTGGAVLVTVWLVRLGLDRQRMARWEADWERFDTPRGWKTG